jgi:hypothetical protein
MPPCDLHWTDVPKGGGKITRRLRSWSNVKRLNLDGSIHTDWASSASDAAPLDGLPDNWIGLEADYDVASMDAALQIIVKTRSDKPNWFVRRADNPNAWMRWFLPDAVEAVAEVDRDNKRITWPGFRLDFESGAAAKTFVLADNNAPTSYRLAFLLPDGYTYELADSVLRALDSEDVEVFSTKHPTAYDSATTYLSPDGRQPMRCTLVEDGTLSHDGDTWVVLRLDLNQDDLDSAVFPVEADPTVQITGATDIDDTYLSEGQPEINGGVYRWSFWGGIFIANNVYRMVERIATSTIPADGTITGFRMYGTRIATGYSAVGDNMDAYRITAGNDWNEGVKNNAQSTVGEVCWLWRRFWQAYWLGTAGCGTSGTDYVADPSPPTMSYTAYTSGSDVPFTITLDPAWPVIWRNAGDNKGMMWRSRTEANETFFWFYSSDSPTTPAYYEIDYLLASHQRRNRSRDRARNRGRD